MKICSRCIYDESIPGIVFDDKGVCNYCHQIDQLKEQYQTGKRKGIITFEKIVKQIKKDGEGKKYDCVVGVSGGTDSSFLLDRAIYYGLRPLAVHYDNTWNTGIATQNIRKLLEKTNVDLYTHVVNNIEMDDIFLSFFKASVPDLDCSTDIALAETLYRAANKYKVKYILEGHSYLTEGIAPLGYIYMDGKYISSIHSKFGRLKMDTFPNMTFFSFLKWVALKRIKKIRPLWYLPYSKEPTREYLKRKYDWKYYGGHHLENRITALHNNYYAPTKFGIDTRNNSLSAEVRAGQLTREEAIEIYSKPPEVEKNLLQYFKKRLYLSDEKFNEIMAKPKKYFYNYSTYKIRFEKYRVLFKLLAGANLVPMSFYLKYCFPFEYTNDNTKT